MGHLLLMERSLAVKWIVAGLGNPGLRYARDRHNIGFQVIDALTIHLGSPPFQNRFQSYLAQTITEKVEWIVVKPQTYMNLSGEAVVAVAKHYQVPAEHILVVHDELEFPLGRLKLKQDGGEAGHRGLLSISQELNTRSYPRLRFGIGRPPNPSVPISDYVLQPPSSEEEELWQASIARAVNMICSCCEEGLTQAMNQWNSQSLSGLTSETGKPQ